MTLAVHKVLGTETEFGISVRGRPGYNPVTASSLAVGAYAGSGRVRWSYDDETPGRDARGFGSGATDFDNGMLNAVLPNGARLYVDHAHPEYSTPECFDALEAALYDKAGEVILGRAAAAAQGALGPGECLLIHKNNSDGKGNSYGAHENYLMARKVPFGDIVAHLTAFLVTRQVFTGAGKVGSENGRPGVPFQLSQRADFFEERVGLETTLKRPIVNTRDEPHADPGIYRRLHVIVGDSNLSEKQILLKLGSTALVLAALEAGALGEPLLLEDPVRDMWRVSHDPGLRRTIRLEGGRSVSPLDLQRRYLGRAAAYAAGAGPVEARVLALWGETLDALERDPASTAGHLDWAAKLRLLEEYRARDGLAWSHPKLRLLDLQYHDIAPERSLYRRLVRAGRMERLFTDAEVEDAAGAPPERTRAYFRGRALERFGEAVVAANWESLIFEVGEAALVRVPMMEPLRGSRERVADLIDRSATAADLIRALGGANGRTGTEATPADRAL